MNNFSSMSKNASASIQLSGFFKTRSNGEYLFNQHSGLQNRFYLDKRVTWGIVTQKSL